MYGFTTTASHEKDLLACHPERREESHALNESCVEAATPSLRSG
jgi:hypothetical protein